MPSLMTHSPQPIDVDPWLEAEGDAAQTASTRAAKSPDEWKHIADSTQRKKVQNRNAQRTYRHKLKRRIAELERMNSKLASRQATCSPKLSPASCEPDDSGRSHSHSSHSRAHSHSRSHNRTTSRAHNRTNSYDDHNSDRNYDRHRSTSPSCNCTPPATPARDHSLPATPPLRAIAPPSSLLHASAATAAAASWADDAMEMEAMEMDAMAGFDPFSDIAGLLEPPPAQQTPSPFLGFDLAGEREPIPPLDALPSLPSSYSSSSYSSPYSSSYSAAAAVAASMPLNDGRTTLHLAVEQDHLAVISMLLAGRADAFAQDFCGASALHIAAARGNAAATRLLLDAAAAKSANADKGNPQAARPSVTALRDGSGATPLHLAAAGGHEGAVAALLGLPGAGLPGAGSTPSSSSLSSAFHSEERQSPNTPDFQLAPRLSDPNALDASCQTPLHLAAVAGCEPVVQMLLDAGAHVQSKAANGSTALHVAGCAGHERIVALLLRHGAEVDCRVDLAQVTE